MIRKFISGSEFRKNVSILMTGSLIAQLIPFAISPILARLYEPEDFGVLSLFVSISSILLVVSTLKYEVAILLPKEERDARSIFQLSNISAISISTIILLACFLLQLFFPSLTGSWGINEFIYLIPLMVLLGGLYNSHYYMLNRQKKFKSLSVSKVQQNFITGGSNIGFGLISAGFFGLLISRVVGQLISVIYLFNKARKDRTNFNRQSIKDVAKRYSRFPRLMVFAQFVNTLSLQAPVLLISYYFGPLLLGLYALTYRVVMTPIGVVASSFGDVFREEASRQYRTTQNFRMFYIKTLRSLLALAIIPCLLILITAPTVFDFVFGSKWFEAGVYAQILAPMFLLQFVARPLTNVFVVTERQDLEVIWQLLLLVASGLPFIIAALLHRDIDFALILFSTFRSVYYFAVLVVCYLLSRK